ncbi:hypothetical protein ACU8KH_05719 [Lachancea thermotolerans]
MQLTRLLADIVKDAVEKGLSYLGQIGFRGKTNPITANLQRCNHQSVKPALFLIDNNLAASRFLANSGNWAKYSASCYRSLKLTFQLRTDSARESLRLTMGIPVTIFDGGLLWPNGGIKGFFKSCQSEHVEHASRPGLAQRRSSGWDLDSGPCWRLERAYTCEDTELTRLPSYKRVDGQFWCFWRPDGSKVGIVAADGNTVLSNSMSLSLPSGISAMDIVNAHSVAFGTYDGVHGVYDLGTNRVVYANTSFSQPITHVWCRVTADGGSVVTFSSHNTSISVVGLSGVRSETTFLRGGQPTLRPIESVDLNAAATKIAMCDARNVWVHELTSYTYQPVPGLFLQEGEFVVSLKFAGTRDSLLVATSQRLLIYEPGTTYAVPVCNMRHGAVFEFFEEDSRIMVEQQHLYGTHMACFALDEHTSQWSQVGYSDVRAQFGIRKVHYFFALRSQLHVLSDSGNYSRFTSTEDS